MMRWDTLILTCVFTSVSVQELAKTQQYKVIKGKALNTTYGNVTVTSAIECCLECSLSDSCNSVSFSYATKTCGLSQVRLSDKANTTILDNDSVVYGKSGVVPSSVLGRNC